MLKINSGLIIFNNCSSANGIEEVIINSSDNKKFMSGELNQLYCPVCKINEIDVNDLFCFKCGRNIHVHQFKLSEDTDIEKISDTQKFRVLNYELLKMVNVEITVEEQQEYLSALNKVLNVMQTDVEMANEIISNLENSIRSLNSFTLTNLKAKIMRNKKQKIKQQKEKLGVAREFLSIFKIQEKVTIRYLEFALSDMDKLTDRLSKKIDIRRWKNEYLKTIDSQHVEVYFEKNREFLREIENYQADLAVIASKLRRLEISNKFFKSALDDLDAIGKIQDENSIVNPFEVLNDHTILFDIEVKELPALKFYGGNARRKLQGAIAYGKDLGSISVLIPNAGTISMNDFYEGIVPDVKNGKHAIDYIIENHETIIKKIKQKINYLDSILLIIYNSYQELLKLIQKKEQERADIEIQIVEAKK